MTINNTCSVFCTRRGVVLAHTAHSAGLERNLWGQQLSFYYVIAPTIKVNMHYSFTNIDGITIKQTSSNGNKSLERLFLKDSSED